ncbi:hypothetical protein DSB65_08230 [Lactobacillus delbrueckii]|nr:hypothetical protein [Lactobacillus delbrueckii]
MKQNGAQAATALRPRAKRSPDFSPGDKGAPARKKRKRSAERATGLWRQIPAVVPVLFYSKKRPSQKNLQKVPKKRM